MFTALLAGLASLHCQEGIIRERFLARIVANFQLSRARRRPAYSGVRAKLTSPSQHGEKRVADFIIQRDPQFPCVVQLMGIESPGLTSAPSIAEQVRDVAAEILGGSLADALGL
jgi:L-2-hydroxyglutarate oxidase LhgO